jgi:uncharacterized protein YaaN involved in tellurite resistance
VPGSIDVTPLFSDDEPPKTAAVTTTPPPGVSPDGASPFPGTPVVNVTGHIPSDDEISQLGAGSRTTYNEVTARILAAHQTSDLGAMGAKLNEMIAVAKGLDINKGKSSLVEKGLNFFRSEREQILAHVQTVQTRLDGLVKEVQAMKEAERSHVATLGDLQKANFDYHEQMKTALAQAQGWLAAVQAELATPMDQSDSFAAPKRAAVQQLGVRLERSINDCQNAMTLAKQEALTIQQETANAQVLLDEFERAQTIVLPALRSIVAQQLIQVDQKHAAETDNLLRSTLDDALRTQAQMTGDNSIELAKLQQTSAISMTTLLDCENILDAAATKVKEIQDQGRQLRLQDATTRSQVEQRLLARFSA